MIIVKLIGGLGNQMFQYAAGRRLAKKLGVELKLDVLGFEEYKLHRYSLCAFSIKEKFASREEVLALTALGWGVFAGVARRLLGRPPVQTSSHFKEKKLFCFDPEVFTLSDNVYLDGSWQNEKYFKDIEDIIRREFTVKASPEGRNKELLDEMSGCESVALHVRRADFVDNAYTAGVHGVCGVDYYERAVRMLADRLAYPRFYVFSDDPGWAGENLKLGHPTTVVDHNGADKNYEDLRLMSGCKHQIIANSTFSWWGAWLNQNQGKVVIAPGRWMLSNEYDASDVVPRGWEKLQP